MRKTPRPGSVAVEKLTITLADLRKLTDQDRYSYYLLGHMFNELMCLQKLIHYAMPTHGDRREFRRNPEMFQTIFLFRIALSKISETWKELRERKQGPKSHLSQSDRPILAGGRFKPKKA